MATLNPTSNGAPTGLSYVDSLIAGGSWTPVLGNGVTLAWAPVTSDLFNGKAAAGRAWSADEIATLRHALQLWSDVANLTFTELPAGDTGANLNYLAQSEAQMTATIGDAFSAGVSELPSDDIAPLSVVFLAESELWTPATLVQGGVGFLTVIHEIGHQLGLAHPHDGGKDGQIFPGVNDPFDIGTFGLNQGIWTLMSYNDGWTSKFPPLMDHTYGVEGTPMALDVAAIQAIYGTNTTFHTGDDIYALPQANAAGSFWSCIWDAGGSDTISAAGTATAAFLDLRAAPLDGPQAGGYVSRIGGIVGGFTIAHGAVIENATGGSGNDTITGNDAANRLDGGTGADRMAGGTGDDIYIVDSATDRVIELAGQGTDTIRAGVDWTLTGGVENLMLTGTATTGTGNALGNVLQGNALDNTLSGGGGNDTLTGGGGADRLTGGSGRDTFVIDAGADVITDLGAGATDIVQVAASASVTATLAAAWMATAATSNAGSATVIAADLTVNVSAAAGPSGWTLTNAAGTASVRMTGSAQADTLIGGIGNDILKGGGGDDSFQVTAGQDRILDLGGGDSIQLSAGASVSASLAAGWTATSATRNDGGTATIVANGHDVDLSASAGSAGWTVSNGTIAQAVALAGSARADFLRGGTGADTLSGNAGDDRLAGGAGDDTLTGGADADTFRFVLGSDGFDTITDFAAGTDVLSLAGFGLADGVLAANRFVAGTAATEARGQFLYDGASGVLSWDTDGTGGTGARAILKLDGAPALSAGDIHIARVFA